MISHHASVAFFITVLFTSISSAQVDTAWIRTYDGPGKSVDVIRAIAFDTAGNIYATGESMGSGGRYDYALITYDPEGNVRWLRRFDGGATGDDYAKVVALDKTGNVYVGGFGVLDLASLNDFMIVKYAPNGDSLWTAIYNGIGGASMDQLVGMAVDDSGYVFAAGYSYNSLQPDPHDNFALLKYDGAGSQIRETTGGADDFYVRALAHDHAGNTYVTGYATYFSGRYLVSFKYDETLNMTALNFFLTTPDVSNVGNAVTVDDSLNYYVAGYVLKDGTGYFTVIKYDASGSLKWAQLCNGPGGTSGNAYAIVVDAQGRVFATGVRATGQVNQHVFTIAVSPAGDTLWTAGYDGGSGNDAGLAIALDSSGSVIVTGYLYSGVSYYKADIVTLWYDKNGNQQLVRVYDSPSHGYDYGNAVAVDHQGSIYIGGQAGTQYGCDFVVIKYINKPIGVSGDQPQTPSVFALEQNYPNPFNPATVIRYSIPVETYGRTSLRVYDLLGREVAVLVNEHKPPGRHQLTFDGAGLSTGVYICRLTAGRFTESRKMMLIK